jgi:hypothetical protein
MFKIKEYCVNSTISQDKEALTFLKSQLGQESYYNPLWNSCRTYSEVQFDYIKNNILNIKYEPLIFKRKSIGIF